MTNLALTRDVSPEINRCELTFIARQPIDATKAAAQHLAYRQTLAKHGLQVVNLPSPPHTPDGVFVEDPAVILDEVAIITRMGSEHRQAEVQSFAEVVKQYRTLHYLAAPGTLEGGDVLRIGKTLFIGRSSRTNQSGVDQLTAIVTPLGYTVRASDVLGCLHFKTGCSYVGQNTVLLNPAWVDSKVFEGYRLLEVSADEPFAANAILLGDTVLHATGAPKTQALLKSLGFTLELVDISELMKAEAGLTCMSQIFQR